MELSAAGHELWLAAKRWEDGVFCKIAGNRKTRIRAPARTGGGAESDVENSNLAVFEGGEEDVENKTRRVDWRDDDCGPDRRRGHRTDQSGTPKQCGCSRKVRGRDQRRWRALPRAGIAHRQKVPDRDHGVRRGLVRL